MLQVDDAEAEVSERNETHGSQLSTSSRQKALSPYAVQKGLPDFVLTTTRIKIRPKVAGTRGKGQSNAYRLPRLQGHKTKDPTNGNKIHAYKGMQEFWKRKVGFRLFE